MSDAPSSEVQSEYRALFKGAGVCDFGSRTLIEITGRDRAALLHSLCTNDIKALAPGAACEAFLTNAQGRTTGYVYVYCQEDSLILDTAPGQAPSILGSLERYIIREDVQLHDRSQSWSELLLSGREAKTCLQRTLQVDRAPSLMSHLEAAFAGQPVQVRRVPFAGAASFFLTCSADLVIALREVLKASGATDCSGAALEIARVEAGSPLYGVDLSEQNLPQEVDRNEQAISFTKGCYLGQETVARLNALGHVNRVLRGLQFHTETIPPAGAEIHDHGKVIAQITSAAWSVRLGTPLALAYVRHGHEQAGQILHSTHGEAEVVSLPLG
ncbi:MAG: folate-binding protein YgfZ [Pirellulaceae bacterium]